MINSYTDLITVSKLSLRHADHLLKNVRYRPMLLGENYLRRIGALLEF